MKFLFTAFAAGMLLLSFSCNERAQLTNKDEVQFREMNKAEEETNYESQTTDTSFGNAQQQPKIPALSASNGNTSMDWDKKIVKNASVSMEVKDLAGFSKELRNQVRQTGGYISSESSKTSPYKMESIITIKVPVAQFDEALLLITASADKIVDKSVTTDDVTGTIFDTKSRLEAKKSVRLRYLELLKQAKNMEEILKVQAEINSIQEEIEAASGRISYLGHSAAFSTINLTCFQVLNPAFQPDENPGFLTQVKGAFINGAQWTGELIIFLIGVWPLWLVLLFSIIAIKRWKMPKTKSA